MDISVNYGGLKLKNPLIAASGGITGDAGHICRAAENGAAAAVMKTLFEEEYTRKNPSPCFKIINRQAGSQSSTTFYTFEQASPYSPLRYGEEILKAREKAGIPVIASINCVTAEKWPEFAKRIQDAGADALELNIFSLPTDLNRTAQESEAVYFDVIEKVTNLVTIPVAVKISHYNASLASFIVSIVSDSVPI